MAKDKRRRTLVLSIVFSSFGPFVTGYALLMNTAATQLADFIRRSAELGVLIMALWIFNALRGAATESGRGARLAKRLYLASGSALVLSGLFLVVLFIRGLFEPSIPEGDVRVGLAVALLGILFNGFFFIRYLRFDREATHAVMKSQSRLYQAKAIVDLNVVVALGSVLFFEASRASHYLDQAGTLIVASYLLVRGITLARREPSS